MATRSRAFARRNRNHQPEPPPRGGGFFHEKVKPSTEALEFQGDIDLEVAVEGEHGGRNHASWRNRVASSWIWPESDERVTAPPGRRTSRVRPPVSVATSATRTRGVLLRGGLEWPRLWAATHAANLGVRFPSGHTSKHDPPPLDQASTQTVRSVARCCLRNKLVAPSTAE